MGLNDHIKKLELMRQEKNELLKKTLEVNAEINKDGKITEQAKNIGNLFGTEAGQMALEMYEAGGVNGRISASVWNAYAEGHEGRTTISENGSISVFDAMNSITTYMIREEAKENGPNAEPTEKDDPNIDYD